MKYKILGALMALFFFGQVSAAPVVAVTEWKVKPGQALAFAKAIDDLQQTDLAKDRTAQLQLQASSYNGVNPATDRKSVV